MNKLMHSSASGHERSGLPARRLGRLLLRVPAIAAVLLAAGCSFIPAYQRPEAPIAATWPSGINEPTGVAPVAELPWQQFFTDPRLSALIEIALFHNRDLRVASLAVEQARALYGVRRADLFPTIGAGGIVSRSPAVVAGRKTNITTYNVGLQVNAWEIDFFGRIESLKEAALAQYLASEQGARAAQISLVSAVANTWFSLLADQQLLEITRQTLETRQQSQRLAQLRFNNGVTSELDLRQAESLTESANASLAALQRQRALDEDALTLLVGQPIDMRLTDHTLFGEVTPNAIGVADVPAGLPSDLLQRRPDILQAEQQLLAANANIGAARAAFFPRITLTAGLGLVSNQLSGLFQGGAFGVTASSQALLPIFDFGRNESNLEFARVGRRIAVAQYQKAIQSAFRDVADALAGRATLGEQLRATRAQARAESVRFKLADMRYQNGISSYLELLDAQRALFGTQQAVVQTRLAQLQSRVLLYKALGGGWSEAAVAPGNVGPDGKPLPNGAPAASEPAFQPVPTALPAAAAKPAPAVAPGPSGSRSRKKATTIIRR